MKFKRVLIALTVLAATLILSLAGCGIQSGEKGDKGEVGNDGLSAYEIYCKNYIYIESEKQWIDDLVAGRLENIDNSVLEEKMYWQETDVDYTEDQIILVTDKYFYDKTFTVDDFHMIDVEKVELLDDYSKPDKPGNQIYLITLKNAGRQNVIKAIRKLEIFAFTKSAGPNMIEFTD